MRKSLVIFIAIWAVFSARAQDRGTAPLRLVQSISLPDVPGGLDHMGIDIQGQRLFIPAEQHKTVEVVDLRSEKLIHTIQGFSFPRTVYYRPQSNEIFVVDADGICKVFSGESYELVKTIKLSAGPDNAAYDPTSQYLYVAVVGVTWTASTSGVWDVKVESPSSLVSIIDTATAKHLGDIKIDGANIQAMAFDPSGPRMFLNDPDRDSIAVIDRQKRVVLSMWPLKEWPRNHAIALDATHHRLFVGSRMPLGPYHPGRMVVLNADTGKVVNSYDIAGGSDSMGADKMFYDPANQRIYISGGGGFVDVFKELDPDHYKSLGRISTGFIAKTSLFVPELSRLYVAVPQEKITIPLRPEVKIEEAKILVYDVVP